MNNKIKIIVLPITLFIISTILVIIPDNFQSFGDFIAQFSYFSYALKSFLVFILVIIFIAYHFTSVGGVVNKFNQFDKIRPDIINKLVHESMETYREVGIEFRVNVLIARRRIVIWKRLFTLKRPFLFQQQLETVYHYNMNRERDKDLGLITKQGVAGLAFENPEGEHIIVDLENTTEQFNMEPEQLKRTAGIKFIISTPILKWDQDTGNLTDKVIGVVNIDSRKSNFEYIQNKIIIDDLAKNCYDIADVISMLY